MPAEPDRMDPFEALGRIATLAELHATAAHARGRPATERQWLDVLAIIERARP